LRRAKTITIYATRTGGREPISKSREGRKEGRKKLELRSYRRWAVRAKAENPRSIDDRPAV
jgi:hypothetical protein